MPAWLMQQNVNITSVSPDEAAAGPEHFLSPGKRFGRCCSGTNPCTISRITGFRRQANLEIAKVKGYTIITFDADFYELQTIKGFPPKIIWLRFGNMTRPEFINFFQNNVSTIREFLNSKEYEEIGCLEFK